MSALVLDAGQGAALYPAVQALLALVALVALVWYGRRALAGHALLGTRGERLKLEERLALDLRNSLVIVRVDQRRLLLATSANGTAQLITELAQVGTETEPRASLRSEHAAQAGSPGTDLDATTPTSPPRGPRA